MSDKRVNEFEKAASEQRDIGLVQRVLVFAMANEEVVASANSGGADGFRCCNGVVWHRPCALHIYAFLKATLFGSRKTG